MVATVQIGEINGPTGTQVFTDKTTTGTITFCNADSTNPGSSSPLVIPTAGLEYSYKKSTRLKVTVAPSVNISNLRFYTDGTDPWVANSVNLYAKAVASYSQATAAETSTASYAQAFSNYVVASPLSLGTGTFTGTGEKGSLCVMMMTVGTAANPGQQAAETVTYAYDEI